jgi:hypothetical protein
MIIDGEEYLRPRDAVEILKSKNIKSLNILNTLKYRIKKRNFIKKVDVENLVTFHKESELLRKEFAEKKDIVMADLKNEMYIKIQELKEKYSVPADVDSVNFEGKEYISSILAAIILKISLQKLMQLRRFKMIQELSPNRNMVLKSDIERIKLEAGTGVKKIWEKYSEEIETQQKRLNKEQEEWWQEYLSKNSCRFKDK